jgi:hypothetical protein
MELAPSASQHVDQSKLKGDISVFKIFCSRAGPKGTGKTFQTELSFKKMNVEPIIMSSGELESEVAGRPGYLIRRRYRMAADMSKSRGVLSCLMINDIDAGLGRFEVLLDVFSLLLPLTRRSHIENCSAYGDGVHGSGYPQGLWSIGGKG